MKDNTITKIEAINDSILNQQVKEGGKESDIYFPDTLSVVVNDKEEMVSVQWVLNNADMFSSEKVGSAFTYSAKIVGDYILTDGLVLPTMTVTIQEDSKEFNESKIVDNVKITVKANKGVFPKDASLKVVKIGGSKKEQLQDALDAMEQSSIEKEIQESLKNVDLTNNRVFYAFDISIYSKDGKEIQPDTRKGSVSVSFSNPNPEYSTSQYTVYHQNETSGAIETLASTTNRQNMLEVQATSFSPYMLSVFTGDTKLPIIKLTGIETELSQSGFYYVDKNTNLTYTGANSTSSNEAGGNGLKIKNGVTAYIYIPEGSSFSAKGGKGFDASKGLDAQEGALGFNKWKDSGNWKSRIGTAVTPSQTGKAGQTSTGGGAGIYVPASSSLIVIGHGSLSSTGGKGGNASDGTNGAISHTDSITHYADYSENKTIKEYALYIDDQNVTDSITSVSKDTIEFKGEKVDTKHVFNFSIGSGGAGGAGGAGGGAGIGTNGANGANGVNGGEASMLNSARRSNTVPSNPTVSASASGTISIDSNITQNVSGGKGGNEGAPDQSEEPESKKYTVKLHNSNGELKQSVEWTTYDGQAGASGAKGGNGASIGTGGQGGASGQGGYSGMAYNIALEKSYKHESVPTIAKKGNAGANGTDSTLGELQYPYNTVTFTGASSDAEQKYYLYHTESIKAPSYNAPSGTTFEGWKVTTAAENLPDVFSEIATDLIVVGRIYQAGDTISTKGICGNVVLEAILSEHEHKWKYEADGNTIYAYCIEKKNASTCKCQGKENAKTLVLNANNMSYTGNPYTGAKIDKNDITSITKVEASKIQYVGREGTTYSESETAPEKVGTYTAKVTLGGVSATQSFEIKKREITVVEPTVNDTLEFNNTKQKLLKSAASSKKGTIEYKVNDGKWSTDLPEATNYGEYKIYYRMKDLDTDSYSVDSKYLDGTSFVSTKINDSTKPTGEISISENKWNSFLHTITFDLFFHKTQAVTIKAEDKESGIDKVYYYVSNVEVSQDNLETVEWKEGTSLNIDPDKKYVIYSKIVDKEGNMTYISSNGVVLDATIPVIEGIENNKTYCEKKTITVSDAYFDTIQINGENIQLENNQYTLDASNDAQEIVVTDKAGNKTEYTVIIHEGHTYDEGIIKEEPTCTETGVKVYTCSVCKDEKKETVHASGHNWTSWKTIRTSTNDTEGLRRRECIVCDEKEDESLPTMYEKTSQNYIKQVIVKDGGINTSLNTSKEDLVKDLITEKEKEVVNSGKTAKIWLEVAPLDETSVKEEDKARMEAMTSKIVGSDVSVAYVDLSLWKKIEDSDAQAIHNSNELISISLSVPESLVNTDVNCNRTYYVLRMHEGKCDVLDSIYDKQSNTVTFKTNKFSTYAITYKDTKVEGVEKEEIDSNPKVVEEKDNTKTFKKEKVSKKVQQKKHSVRTGVQTMTIYWACLGVISLMAIVLLCIKKSKM